MTSDRQGGLLELSIGPEPDSQQFRRQVESVVQSSDSVVIRPKEGFEAWASGIVVSLCIKADVHSVEFDDGEKAIILYSPTDPAIGYRHQSRFGD